MVETTANSNSSIDTQTEDNAAESRKRNRGLSSVQVLFAVILTVGLMLALNFSSRIQADRELQRIHNQVIQEIAFLERQQTDLISELNYVKSDAYVETWARDEGKMVLEGEVLVLPQPVSEPEAVSATPVPMVDFETTPPEPENWELWWSLFFDTDAPSF